MMTLLWEETTELFWKDLEKGTSAWEFSDGKVTQQNLIMSLKWGDDRSVNFKKDFKFLTDYDDQQQIWKASKHEKPAQSLEGSDW